ncbi:MAG: hypothetical protein ACRDQ0_23835 [Pseudonocardia sp.]
MSVSCDVRRGLVALLIPTLFMAGAAGCAVVSCGSPPPEQIPGLLEEADIVLTPEAELVGVGYGCWQDDSMYLTIAVPPTSADDLLHASGVRTPLPLLASSAYVGDGSSFSTIEPGPGIFMAVEPDRSRDVVVDSSDPDRTMIYVDF